MNDQPRVTVLLATYQWTSVLRYAIQTVLWQTFTDFELLVIGDCCTDDTAAVVISFDDPRVRWHNLPSNTGSQAGPNNAGLALARGQFIAYAHQDDLWMPNHLAVLVEALATSSVSVAHTLVLDVGPPPEQYRRVVGLPNTGKFGVEKRALITPSIMHRVEAAQQIGGWRDWKLITDSPALDFWKRMLDADKPFASVYEVTVIKFNSADRRNSYRDQKADEQVEFLARIRSEPDFLYREVLLALDHTLRGWQVTSPLPPRPDENPAGWYMDQLRRLRGLEATPLPSSPPITWRSLILRPIRWLRNRVPLDVRKRVGAFFVKIGKFIERAEVHAN